MRNWILPLMTCLALVGHAPLVAAQGQDTSEPAAPELPEDEGLEPQVTIIQSGAETIEEYRVGGQLYMIKITPNKGRPYYLVDADGDGQLETRRNDLDSEVRVPSWVLFRW